MSDILTRLEALIQDRKKNPKAGSYTNRLFEEGIGKISQKVGEEAVEVIVAAMAQTRDRQIEELSDLFYHILVLMAQLDITLDEVGVELQRRHEEKSTK